MNPTAIPSSGDISGTSRTSENGKAPVADKILNMLLAISIEQQDTLLRQFKEQRKAAKSSLNPQLLGLATSISTAKLQYDLVKERKIQPLQEQMSALGHRKQGPTVAHRWIEAQVKAFRPEWKDLAKDEKKSRLEAKRREFRESDEFARFFPFEAYKARREAGIEPFILIEL